MYSIRFSHLAAQDLEEAYLYISKNLNNPAAAENLVLETEESLEGLREFPYSSCLNHHSSISSLQ